MWRAITGADADRRGMAMAAGASRSPKVPALGGGKMLLVHDATAAHQMKTELERNQRLAAMGEMAARWRTSCARRWRRHFLHVNLASLAWPTMARARFSDKATSNCCRLERLIQDVLLFARGEHRARRHSTPAICSAKRRRPSNPDARAWTEFAVVLVGCEQAVDRRQPQGAVRRPGQPAGKRQGDTGRRQNLPVRFAGGKAIWLAIGVRDSGLGISQQTQARIFEPLFTTKGQGTGWASPSRWA